MTSDKSGWVIGKVLDAQVAARGDRHLATRAGASAVRRCRAKGGARVWAHVGVAPVTTPRDDVVNTVALCRQHGDSITARGGGTTQAGQDIGPGIALDFSRNMTR